MCRSNSCLWNWSLCCSCCSSSWGSCWASKFAIWLWHYENYWFFIKFFYHNIFRHINLIAIAQVHLLVIMIPLSNILTIPLSNIVFVEEFSFLEITYSLSTAAAIGLLVVLISPYFSLFIQPLNLLNKYLCSSSQQFLGYPKTWFFFLTSRNIFMFSYSNNIYLATPNAKISWIMKVKKTITWLICSSCFDTSDLYSNYKKALLETKIVKTRLINK